MSKTVLAVGNCAYDHAGIEQAISGRFDAKVIRAADLETALETLRGTAVDLVLVNRRLHADSSDGLGVIRRIKAAPQLAATPVMLLSNYPEYQQSAVAAGAEPGFGKAELDSPQTEEKLRRFLA
jgi:two-component system chemotaxis response regulator CheY